MKTATFTELRNNLKNYIDSVIDDSDTVIINRSSGKGAVLMSLAEYNSIKETEYIMSSPEMMKRIRNAEDDMTAGNGQVVDPDDLWK